jgi:hypothetical protein
VCAVVARKKSEPPDIVRKVGEESGAPPCDVFDRWVPKAVPSLLQSSPADVPSLATKNSRLNPIAA